ncbi:MAG: helix-turn-helix domain-containing protein [Candidatus Gracilibacteria bacterium]|jgi:hypothetical protein|nr:helix-turn-helix domain-containing protein [Candidatus Gracilibacteria bacterium]
MVQEYLTIQEAADLVNKSFQTLRRAIKSNKIKYRRQRTPQGFNYMIIKESLFDYYKVNPSASENLEVSESSLKAIPVEKAEIVIETAEKKSEENKIVSEEKSIEKNEDYLTKEDLSAITQTLEKMISQHSEERQNFIRLINTLNEKIFTLENQVKLLSAPKKSWLSFWKK